MKSYWKVALLFVFGGLILMGSGYSLLSASLGPSTNPSPQSIEIKLKAPPPASYYDIGRGFVWIDLFSNDSNQVDSLRFTVEFSTCPTRQSHDKKRQYEISIILPWKASLEPKNQIDWNVRQIGSSSRVSTIYELEPGETQANQREVTLSLSPSAHIVQENGKYTLVIPLFYPAGRSTQDFPGSKIEKNWSINIELYGPKGSVIIPPFFPDIAKSDIFKDQPVVSWDLDPQNQTALMVSYVVPGESSTIQRYQLFGAIFLSVGAGLFGSAVLQALFKRSEKQNRAT